MFGSVLGADGVGKIVDIKDGIPSKFKLGDRVVVNPGTGWIKDPRGPEEAYYILGGGHASGTHAALQFLTLLESVTVLICKALCLTVLVLPWNVH